MSNSLTKYKYYISGDTLYILAYNDQYGSWLTPTEDEDDAILVRYTIPLASVTSEEDNIDVDNQLAKAIVYYVKSRFYEDIDERKAEYYYKKFLQYKSKSKNNKRSSFPVTIPNSMGVLK